MSNVCRLQISCLLNPLKVFVEEIFPNEILPCGAKSKKELLIKKDKMSHFIKIDETYRFIKRILSE